MTWRNSDEHHERAERMKGTPIVQKRLAEVLEYIRSNPDPVTLSADESDRMLDEFVGKL